MKAHKIFVISGAIAANVMAGGLNTNTNQSIAYQRNVARYATTENDAPYFNPGGLIVSAILTMYLVPTFFWLPNAITGKVKKKVNNIKRNRHKSA